MNAARTQRNLNIQKMYADLKASGVRYFDIIETIFNSPENKQWCLAWDTIRLIMSYRAYGNRKRCRKATAK